MFQWVRNIIHAKQIRCEHAYAPMETFLTVSVGPGAGKRTHTFKCVKCAMSKTITVSNSGTRKVSYKIE